MAGVSTWIRRANLNLIDMHVMRPATEQRNEASSMYGATSRFTYT